MRYNSSQMAINFINETVARKGKLKYGEFFSGGLGCASAAKKHPNIDIRWVLNHDKVAIQTAYFHLPGTQVYWQDIYTQDEHELEPVDIIQASFECDYHTPAIGSKPLDKQSYMMGWELYRYVAFLQPLMLTVENVPGVKNWAPLDENDRPIKERKGEEFVRWKKALIDLGYNYIESIRVAADDGLATTRKRYFAIFYRDGLDCSFPEFTHDEFERDGKLPWVACKNFIELDNHGQSIFGRQFNENLPKQHRKPLSPNSLKRIAAGIPKYAPGFDQFISTYYGGVEGKDRGQSLESPLATQTSENRHQIITLEKFQFIADHCHADFWQAIEVPLRSQLSRQTKQLFTIEQFVAQYYGTIQNQSLESPLNTVRCVDGHQLITIEKLQFIALYFNSNGNPGANIQSIDEPLSPIMSEPKHQLVTLLEGFDIKARFLNREELAEISSFPRDFFSKPGLKLSHKNAIKMIGNAVPPEWFFKILNHNIETVLQFKQKAESA